MAVGNFKVGDSVMVQGCDGFGPGTVAAVEILPGGVTLIHVRWGQGPSCFIRVFEASRVRHPDEFSGPKTFRAVDAQMGR